MENVNRFLNKSEIKKEAKNWQKQVRKREPKRHPFAEDNDLISDIYKYTADRRDSAQEVEVLGNDSINQLHGISFIDEVIPQLIAKKKLGEKVKILDVGAGMTVFTNQIRQKFGDKVEVFSTGLSKQAFRAELRWNQKNKNRIRTKSLPEKLHPNDLKWRSIKELSNYEEFDLIIDTYGEFAYSTGANMDLQPINGVSTERVFDHLFFIAAKLKPGGTAYLYPIEFGDSYSKQKFKSELDLRKTQLGIEYELSDNVINPDGNHPLRIRKLIRAQED